MHKRFLVRTAHVDKVKEQLIHIITYGMNYDESIDILNAIDHMFTHTESHVSQLIESITYNLCMTYGERSTELPNSLLAELRSLYSYLAAIEDEIISYGGGDCEYIMVAFEWSERPASAPTQTVSHLWEGLV